MDVLHHFLHLAVSYFRVLNIGLVAKEVYNPPRSPTAWSFLFSHQIFEHFEDGACYIYQDLILDLYHCTELLLVCSLSAGSEGGRPRL